MSHKKTTTRSDKAGITSAVLCTIHCLIIPILFLTKYFWVSNSAMLQLPWWWSSLDFVFLAISFAAVYHSANHTTVKWIRASLWVCWGLLTIAILFEQWLHWLAYIASAGLVITHLINIRRIKSLAAQRI